MNKPPLVSIITPVYNGEKFLAEAVQSVQAQAYSNWELILVDDCSTDHSFELAMKLKERDDRIYVYKLPENSGSGIARNKAIQEARGRFIAFLDSDDVWHPEKLSRHIPFMLSTGAAFSHTSYGYIDEIGHKKNKVFHVSQSPVSYADLLKRTEISCLTAVYDVEQIGKYYMSTHRRKQDYALWLSILRTGVVSIPLDEELAYYRQRKGSATSHKATLLRGHISFLIETQSLSFWSAAYYTLHYIFNGIKRYYL